MSMIREPRALGSVSLQKLRRQGRPVVELVWRVPFGRDPKPTDRVDVSSLANPEVRDPVLRTGEALRRGAHGVSYLLPRPAAAAASLHVQTQILLQPSE